MKMTGFAARHSLVEIDRRFGDAYCLHRGRTRITVIVCVYIIVLFYFCATSSNITNFFLS
jgi:hypothetical protein